MPSVLYWAGLVLVPIAAFFAIQLLFLPLIIATAKWERRLVWPYLPVGSSQGPKRELFAPEVGDGRPTVAEPGLHLLPGPYTQQIDRAARRAGFRHLGAFADGKGKLYKIRYDFFLAPDRVTLALAAAGTLAGVPVASLQFYSRTPDGSLLATLNQQSSSEFDLAGLRREMLVPNATFEDLLDRHLARLESEPSAPLLYSEVDPLGDHRKTMIGRIDHLERIGAAEFRDPSREAWGYTLSGAVALAVRMQSQAVRRLVRPDR